MTDSSCQVKPHSDREGGMSAPPTALGTSGTIGGLAWCDGTTGAAETGIFSFPCVRRRKLLSSYEFTLEAIPIIAQYDICSLFMNFI